MKQLSREEIHKLVDYILDKEKDMHIIAFSYNIMEDAKCNLLCNYLFNKSYIIK